MGDYTISISSKLINRLTSDEGKQKPKKTKKQPTIKPPAQEEHSQPSKLSESPALQAAADIGRQLQQQQQQQNPFLFPPPLPSQSASVNAELEAIRSVIQESEQAVERMQKKEAEMVQELTKRAKELHEKEFKLPNQKPMPCLAEKDACLECYREHSKEPLKCAQAVKLFCDCARRAQQHMN
ncbi:copper ion binding protein isoform X2 [Wolffia australiana]|uniref:Uncharacterized protein n=1 Tax=Wolffia australiana TaxID=161112 RepID=H6UGY9_WOLAU|nr:hypothetical protein [Wolffia australiana]